MNKIDGKLLVASRSLRDPNFARTVILMLEHSDEGALGVVLNRPSPKTVEEVWDSIDGPPCDRDDLVYLGGPVPGPMIALHTDERLGEKLVMPGLFMSVQRDALVELVQLEQVPQRLFSGHSGWAGGQLEGELAAGGWVTGSAEVDDVFSEPQDCVELWEQVLNRIGMSIMLPGVSTDKLPPDARWN